MFFKKEKKINFSETYLKSISSNHFELSAIFCVDENNLFNISNLFDLSINAIQKARMINLFDISYRMKYPPFYPNIWPGEHYKLLAGFVRVLNPSLIIEIGTYKGLSTLALKKYLKSARKIVTFDLFPWNEIEDTFLTEEDFEDGRLIQYDDDLCKDENIFKHKEILEQADLIFIDAIHDGKMETILLEQFKKIEFKKQIYIIFDDIKLWNMLKFWADISKPKLDLTSFGHWSGTGIVEW